MVLGWIELGDDMPPEEIWLNDEDLQAHFEGLKLKQGPDSGVERVPMDDNHDDEIARWRR